MTSTPVDPYVDLVAPSVNGHGTPPNHRAAEQSLLGLILTGHPEGLDAAPACDYYDPRHQELHRHLEALRDTLVPYDPTVVIESLRAAKSLGRYSGGVYLFELMDGAHGAVGHWGRLVKDTAEARRLTVSLDQARQHIGAGQDPHRVNDALWSTLSALVDPATRPGDRELPPTLLDFLNSDEPTYEWLVPGLLERQDRLILTGGEGDGKTTLLRQFGVQAASGIHPFTGNQGAPVRVLVLDLENSTRQNRREYRALAIQAGDAMTPENFRIEHRLQGIDLTQSDDQEWLEQLVKAVRPDLLVTGPIYKMATGDPSDEKSAKPVAMFVDHLRATYGTAAILEAHSAKPTAGARRRPMEPYGWSGWMRWPEFGLHIAKAGALTPWRGGRDAQRQWPKLLERGGMWPWMASHDEDEIRFQSIRAFILDVGEMPVQRDIADHLKVSVSTLNEWLKKRRPEALKDIENELSDRAVKQSEQEGQE